MKLIKNLSLVLLVNTMIMSSGYAMEDSDKEEAYAYCVRNGKIFFQEAQKIDEDRRINNITDLDDGFMIATYRDAILLFELATNQAKCVGLEKARIDHAISNWKDAYNKLNTVYLDREARCSDDSTNAKIFEFLERHLPPQDK